MTLETVLFVNQFFYLTSHPLPIKGLKDQLEKTMKKRISILFLLLLVFGLAFSFGSRQSKTLVPDPKIDEASGICASRKHPGILYAQNDSGGEPAVFVIDKTGKTLGKFNLDGVKNRDWEDIAISSGPDKNHHYIYVGEIGDNGARYSSIFIYRFKEPNFPKEEGFDLTVKDIDRIEIIYEDGARDAEALFIHPKTLNIYIISKREEQVGLYEVSYPYSLTDKNTARKLTTLPLSWVTAADISFDAKKIILKNYTSVYQWKLKKNQSIAEAMQGKMQHLSYEIEPQGEAICYDHKNKGYFCLSERSEDKPLYLYHYK